MKKVSKIDAAYIAGFFDGEGCISIRDIRKAGGHVRITFSQKPPKVLYEIQKIIGFGTISKLPTGCHHYTFSCKKRAMEFIQLVLPYARVKKEQLNVGLEICKLIGKPGPGAKSKIKDRRFALCKKLKELKYV